MPRYLSLRDIDWPLLAITLIICGLGVLQIFSATHDTKWEDAWWKQIRVDRLGTGDAVARRLDRLPYLAWPSAAVLRRDGNGSIGYSVGRKEGFRL